ncbi:nucleotide sugar dehydrogenase [Streptomyces sp. TP-A0874]|uniref:nucleotide sugar dehydrogenase n=1 Tax=Streptomyces sp. TP-A0874 TaxID=549819 RepID=UPI0008532311|nr:nucleotide sugar dehydrogenase [Streptomyces sp. TP-A0874]
MPVDLAVIGLGRLGLPLGRAATAAGIATLGFDTDARTVAALSAGRPPADGPLTPAELRRMLAGGFRATSDPDTLRRARTIAICVATPAPQHPDPDRGPVEAAARTLAPRLRPRSTVLLESSAYPGTTEEFLRPLLEQGSGLRAGRDFHLACAPNRIGPDEQPPGDTGAPRVVGGLTAGCTESAAAFYRRITHRVVRARGPREAETVHLLESHYRQVNTALANEMALFCHDTGVDLWEVLRCAETGPFGFRALRPGVGGHGAQTAPLTHRGPGRPPRLVELARRINHGMPGYVVDRCADLLNERGKALRGARIVLLGVARRPDAGDEQGALARQIAERLMSLGSQLSYHDPYVPHWRVGGRPVPRAEPLVEAAAAADLTLLLRHHRGYDLQVLTAKTELLLDTQGATPAGTAHRL